MSKQWILDRYRVLRVEEREAMEKAIIWCKRKRIKEREIAFLALNNIDRSKKMINLKREGKHIVIWKHISYEGSPLDLYLTEVFPCLKSNRFLFVRSAFTGRDPELCTHIELEKVKEIIEEQAQSLLTLALKFDTIRIAKVNLHIRN